LSLNVIECHYVSRLSLRYQGIEKSRTPRAVEYAQGYIVSILGNAAFLMARPWNTPGLFLYLIKRKNNGTTGNKACGFFMPKDRSAK